MLKPRSFLFYFLAFIVGLLVGLIIAGLVNAGKGQMLAGGAIVLGYGVVGAVSALILSLFLTAYISRKAMIRMNIILIILIVGSYGYFHIRYKHRQAEKNKNEQSPQPLKRPKTKPRENMRTEILAIAESLHSRIPVGKNTGMSHTGLGMFAPNFYENPVLYFYGNMNIEKGITEQIPTDSITFTRLETGGFEIATAPPWLVPHHLKLDYDLLYFKVQTITHDFLEVTVNTRTNQTAYMDKFAGRILFWPEFMLQVNTVKFLPGTADEIHERPFTQSGTTSLNYSFLRPIRVKNEWMHVALLDSDFKQISTGWIRWKKNGELQVTYSLLL